MKRLLFTALMGAALTASAQSAAQGTERDIPSHTEGVINNAFVPEPQMKADLVQMLANFSKYMVDDWNPCKEPNSLKEKCGFFRGENSGGSDERGVRPNADLSMICAFLVNYAGLTGGRSRGVTLPEGVTWEALEDMAMQSLVFAYSTHKANRLKVCAGGRYWGSTDTNDVSWESSLWAMSVAYSAFFQWDKLTEKQRGYIYNLLKAECNYELNRDIPTGYRGDTKAEENGWEADVLAVTLGLFPDDPLAPKWFARLREFAINSYSHPSDATNNTIIDPEYDNTTIANLYRGQNLYEDYTLQNHNLFHTSYQNVVMQELGEAALALKMFQQGLHGHEKWKTNALMHHNQEVQDSVLNWLALADGELAMPNGNDWSLFLYDQITSFSTQACFQRDPHALMLENMAYKYIKARQKTTKDGSWLLRADVGARRMGVEAHRVMMTFLMHEVLSTSTLVPTEWDDFNRKFSEAKLLPCQNVVRAASDYRFTTFSWSEGLRSYTGYFAANSADKNKIVVPYRANNTGNITGWYDVEGKRTNATPVVSGNYQLKGNAYVMNGELNTNDGTLNNRFAIYSTPSNAIIYLDHVVANADATIKADKGGLLAISTDELMKTTRTIYYNKDGHIEHTQTDGATFTQLSSSWVNIDNELGVVGMNMGKSIGFGDRGANNSIFTSKLYPMYSSASRTVKSGDIVDSRNLIYYSNISAADTKAMADGLSSLASLMPKGWNAIIAADNDCPYLMASNFRGDTRSDVAGIQYNGWAPVLSVPTHITANSSSALLKIEQNSSYVQPLRVMLQGNAITAQLADDASCYVTADAAGSLNVSIDPEHNGEAIIRNGISIKKGETLKLYVDSKGAIIAEPAAALRQSDIMAAMECANDFFIAKYPDAGAPTFVKKQRPSNLWTRGVYFEGLYELAEMERRMGGAKQNAYFKYINDWGNAHKWTPRNGILTRDADDYCCSQTYIDMGHIEPTIQCMDNLIACRNVPQTQGNGSSTGSFGDWTWIDAIQMGLPVMTKLSAVMQLKGDPDYLRYAEQGWQMYRTSRDSIAGGFLNKKEGLWWRDKDFVAPFTTPNGEDCYWSRGNGWVYAALVRAMESLPSDPHYNDYLRDYKQMTKALVKRQQPDLFWYASLDDANDYGGKEMTGTALFIYGMAWGVRHGHLPAKQYVPIITDTWNAMVRECLHPNGMLGFVQGTGKEPKDSQPVTYDKTPDFDDYGLGCFLLCGTEIIKMLSE